METRRRVEARRGVVLAGGGKEEEEEEEVYDVTCYREKMEYRKEALTGR